MSISLEQIGEPVRLVAGNPDAFCVAVAGNYVAYLRHADPPDGTSRVWVQNVTNPEDRVMINPASSNVQGYLRMAHNAVSGRTRLCWVNNHKLRWYDCESKEYGEMPQNGALYASAVLAPLGDSFVFALRILTMSSVRSVALADCAGNVLWQERVSDPRDLDMWVGEPGAPGTLVLAHFTMPRLPILHVRIFRFIGTRLGMVNSWTEEAQTTDALGRLDVRGNSIVAVRTTGRVNVLHWWDLNGIRDSWHQPIEIRPHTYIKSIKILRGGMSALIFTQTHRNVHWHVYTVRLDTKTVTSRPIAPEKGYYIVEYEPENGVFVLATQQGEVYRFSMHNVAAQLLALASAGQVLGASASSRRFVDSTGDFGVQRKVAGFLGLTPQ